MGFLFVDRAKNATIPNIIEKTTLMLNETKLNFVFFPEGGTNDGVQMRSFSTSFFQIGLNTHYDIQPLTINILEIDGLKVTDKNIDHVVFHGHAIRLIPHILQLFTLKSIVLQVDLLTPITPDDIANAPTIASLFARSSRKFANFSNRSLKYLENSIHSGHVMMLSLSKLN